MENEDGLVIFFWIGTLIMISMTLGVLLIALIYQRKVLKIRQAESENLLRVSLESEKRERKRIAEDFHDGISGDMITIRNHISQLETKIQDQESRAVLSGVKTSVENMLAEVKVISYNLMPPLLDTLGLIPTLEDYFERIKKWSLLTIHTDFYQRDIPVSASNSYELYRIVQELLGNMLKYGNVTVVHFSIKKIDSFLELEIKDNGSPFDFFENLKKSKGMGLKNILSRSKQIGGKIKQSSSETGNVIQIRFPANESESWFFVFWYS